MHLRLFRNYIIAAFLSLALGKATFAQNSGGAYTLDLCGNWAFQIDPNDRGEAEQWFVPSKDVKGWDSLAVPGNWDLRNEYAHYAGQGWYRKTFSIPENWKGKEVRLCMGSIYHDSRVWLNGALLGENHNGYLPFEYDITKQVDYNGANTVVVMADNRFRRGALWNWGGIRQPVWLQASESARVVRQHITALPDLVKGTAKVGVKLFLQNKEATAQTIVGAVRLQTNNGKAVAVLPFRAQVPANGKEELTVSATLEKEAVHLWHFDDPFLYTSVVTIDGNRIDTLKDRFGIRRLEVDGLSLKLNGESIRPMGYNLVPDDRTTGNTLPLWRIKEDIDLLKSLGCNFARLSHLPMPPEMLDYLDERGIMVMEEIPLWGYDQMVDPLHPHPNKWLTQLVTEHYNHPSIVGWSVGNEIGNNEKVMPYVAGVIAFLKQNLDSSRLGVMVSHTPYAPGRTEDPLQLSDLGLFNAYARTPSTFGHHADTVHNRFPGKPLFYSEYGQHLLSEDPDKAHLNIGAMMNSMRGKPYLVGGSLWTFNDYRSSFYNADPTWTTKSSENRDWGIVNIFRQPKRPFRSFQREYSPVKRLNATAADGALTLQVQPREVLDLPAYSINDYRVVWQAIGQDEAIAEGGIWNLPALRAGAATVQKSFNHKPGTLSRIRVQLVSPLNYTLQDTTLFFEKPVKPVLKTVIKGQEAVRVIFEQHPSATGWKVLYGENELKLSSDTTINHFVDITGLQLGGTYRFAVVAINERGESIPSEPATVTLHNHLRMNRPATLLPPVIWRAEPAAGAVFVGYSVQPDDYLYRFEISSTPDFNATQRYTVQTKGVTQLRGLTDGQLYYGRVQAVKQTLEESAWSETFTFRPDGGRLPAAPTLNGLVRQGKEAVLFFEPVPKATGYQLQYRPVGSGAWISEAVTPARINSYLIKNLQPGKTYEYRLAAINSTGTSGYSQTSNITQKHD